MDDGQRPAATDTRDSDIHRPLNGRRALVTGASRGIGLAIVHSLITAGASVAMVSRSTALLGEMAASLGPDAHPFACDLTDAAEVARLVAEVGASWADGPDILVNNAGVFELAQVHETEPAMFRRALDTNLMAPFMVAHAFLPGMRGRGRGHVVTIGSIADRMVFPENGAYAASKHGARALHEVLRAESRGTGVRVTLISPGPVATSIWDPIVPEGRPGFTPRTGMLDASAVADAVLWAITRRPEVNVDELRLSRS